MCLPDYSTKELTNQASWVRVFIVNTKHKDLKKGMVVLTVKGWRVVSEPPADWLAGTLLVRFTDGTSSVQHPNYRWARRINFPLPR